MKIFILGLDGLENNFVEKWNLQNLKQHEHGKIKVPIDEKIGYPITPEVWASFLTGKHLGNVHFEKTTITCPINLVFSVLKFLRMYIPVSLGLGRTIRENIPERRKREGAFINSFPPLRQRTFLDLANSREINAPYYGYDNAVLNILFNFNIGRLSLRQTIELLNVLYRKRKRQILYETQKLQNADIIFAYMHFPDILQHFLFTRPSEIKRHYVDLDNFVSLLKGKIKGPTLFLIVSDHGFIQETGTHSNYGFYSCNTDLRSKPKQITDFYNLLFHAIEQKNK